LNGEQDSFVGLPVNKVGKKSGWTMGYVTKTNVSLVVAYQADGRKPRRVLLDQVQTDMQIEPGDSGSPVFTGGWFDTWYLLGLAHGRPAGDPTTSWYSPMSGIRRDFGSLGTIQSK
jgi:hypothetical protein